MGQIKNIKLHIVTDIKVLERTKPTNNMSKVFVTKPAPHFDASALLPNGEFGDVKLPDYKGKYVVLFFYPLDFTFVCPTDSTYSHLAWTEKSRKEGGLGKMNIPMLADLNHNISRDYGVLLEEEGIALRGLFVIDGKGILRQVTVNDLPVGRSVDETLRLVQAFQFTDVHGEVCPAGWKPGASTMKADPIGSKEYFKKASMNGGGGVKRTFTDIAN